MEKPSADPQNPIAAKAEKLAYEFDVPVHVAEPCLSKLVQAFARDLRNSPNDLPQALSCRPLCLFEDALRSLSWEQAAQLILEEDLPRIIRRADALGALVSGELPFFTLEELALHAREFARFLKRHREYMVRTGLPPRFFRKCEWLHVHLARLYDTRQTGSVYCFDELAGPGKDVDNTDPYRFLKTRGSSSARSESCRYEEADLLWEMEPADAARIERDRHRVFDAKLRIVEQLSQLTSEADLPKFWQQCLTAFNETFNADEMRFWLRMDHFHYRSTLQPGSLDIRNPSRAPGGITNLFEVIGRYEAEKRQRTLTVAKTNLNKFVNDLQQPVDDRFSPPDELYFRLVGHPDRREADATLDEFVDRLQGEPAFWEDYRNRVQTALEDEFGVAVTIYLRPRHVELLRPLLLREAKVIGARVDAGELLWITPSTKCIFRKDGNTWTISFDGKLIPKFDSPGLAHIAKLLRQPGKPMAATDLRKAQTVRGVDSQSPLRSNRAIVNLESAMLADDDENDTPDVALMHSDAGDVVDDQAERQYRAALAQEEERRLEAKRNGDSAMQQDAERKIADLTKAWNEAHARGPGGRKRNDKKKMSSEATKATKTVSKAIQRALDDLKDAHPALWKHLNGALTSGSTCRYDPEPPVEWEF
jgi:hypothetical protein